MKSITSKLTILFNDPFWIGIFERESDGKYEVAKIVFGSEPKDYQVYEYMLKNWVNLNFSPSLDSDKTETKKINPKRMQREIHKLVQKQSFNGTKAQQAIKLLQEQNKIERKTTNKEQRMADIKRKFEIKANKKKEKHKGH